MKLNQHQINEIEKYLNGLNLNFQSFKDEMLDHLILSIESKKSSENTFDSVFYKLKIELNQSYVEKGNFFYNTNTLKGIKALENISYSRKEKEIRKAYLHELWNTLKSPIPVVLVILLLLSFHFLNFEIIILQSTHFGFARGILGGMLGGISMLFILNPFINRPIINIIFRKGFLGIILKQEQIGNLKNEKLHATWKFLLFPFSIISVALFYLYLVEHISVFLLCIALSLFALTFYPSINLFLKIKSKSVS